METIQYVRALARSWFIVLITLVAGGVGGYYVYHSETPQYQSSVHLVVSGAGPGRATDEVTARVLANQRAQALAQVAPTAPAVKAAATKAGYPSAAPSVSASAGQEGPFLTVNVVDTSAARAQAIANSFAATLPATLAALEGRSDTPINVRNLAPASAAGDPISPKLLNDLALGLAAGLVLGVALALLREGVDRTIRDSEELERVTELTVLGTVPRDSLKSALPATTNPRSVRAEAYRQIRTTLLNSNGQPRTIAVTSAVLGEGKTSVATNLAVVFSRAGHRVALVDADLRRPRVAQVFGLPRKPGLSDVLAEQITLTDALHHLDDGRLAVLTSGQIPANPSEALGGAGMEKVLTQLAAEYEYVIVDTPPVLPVTDALVVAPAVDGVVLVTRLGRTTRERVKRSLNATDRVHARIIGVVPNYASKGPDSDYRYTYKYKGARRREVEGEADIDADLLKPSPNHPVNLDRLPATPPSATGSVDDDAPTQVFRRDRLRGRHAEDTGELPLLRAFGADDDQP